MRVKRLIWLSLVIPLILSLAVTHVASNPETIVYVDPPSVINNALQAPSTFDVSIKVSDVDNLIFWQANMSYDPSVLQATGVTFGDFLEGNPNETLDSSPYDDLTIGTYPTMTDPWASHDLNPDSYTSFKYSDTTGSFVVGNCSSDPYADSEIIQVDLTVRYEATASARNDQYRIVYYGGSYHHPTTKYTLVQWTSAASPLATHVWTNPTNPYGGSWDWTDITKLQIEVETSRGTGDKNAYFNLYEAYVTVTYLRPTFTYKSINNVMGYVILAEATTGEYILGIYGSGWLANVTFEVASRGATVLKLDNDITSLYCPSLPPNDLIPCTVQNGYFRNKYLSDIRGPESPPGSGLYPPDGTVDGWDYAFIGLAFGKTSADPAWDDYKIADIRGPEDPPGSGLYPPDGVVDGWDYAYCGLEFGKS